MATLLQLITITMSKSWSSEAAICWASLGMMTRPCSLQAAMSSRASACLPSSSWVAGEAVGVTRPRAESRLAVELVGLGPGRLGDDEGAVGDRRTPARRRLAGDLADRSTQSGGSGIQRGAGPRLLLADRAWPQPLCGEHLIRHAGRMGLLLVSLGQLMRRALWGRREESPESACSRAFSRGWRRRQVEACEVRDRSMWHLPRQQRPSHDARLSRTRSTTGRSDRAWALGTYPLALAGALVIRLERALWR